MHAGVNLCSSFHPHQAYFPGPLLALRELVDNMLAPGTTRNAAAHGGKRLSTVVCSWRSQHGTHTIHAALLALPGSTGPMCLTIDLEVVATLVDEDQKEWKLKRLRLTGMLCGAASRSSGSHIYISARSHRHRCYKQTHDNNQKCGCVAPHAAHQSLQPTSVVAICLSGNGQHIPAQKVRSILNLGHGEQTYKCAEASSSNSTCRGRKEEGMQAAWLSHLSQRSMSWAPRDCTGSSTVANGQPRVCLACSDASRQASVATITSQWRCMCTMTPHIHLLCLHPVGHMDHSSPVLLSPHSSS
jgi:hypothetical protein